MNALIGLIALAHAGASDLEGRYALEMSVRSTARVPMARSVSTQVSLALVDVHAGPSGLEHHQTVCDVRIETRSPLADTLISDAFIAAIPSTRSHVALDARGGAIHYSVDLGLTHVGYDPALSAGLPTSPADPAVLDWDGDGRPGGTIFVRVFGLGTFGIEVVQRSQARIDGVVGTDGSIEGRVHTSILEQQVLAADRPFLETAPVITLDPDASTFRMVPVSADATCATLVDG